MVRGSTGSIGGALLSVLAVAAVAVGCSSESPRALDRTGQASSAIQDGTTDTSHSFAMGVCIDAQRQGACKGVCSGTLIAPNLVVTARHCVQQVPAGSINCSTDVFGTAHSKIYVTSNYQMFQGNLGWHTVTAVRTPTDDKICGNDIALLVLGDNVDPSEATPATPAVQYPLTDHTRYTTNFTAIGYGVTGFNANGTQKVDAGTRRMKENVKVLCIPGDPDPNLECPDGIVGAGEGGISANEFITGDATCEGDSGSGAYEKRSLANGTPVTLGILSRGGEENNRCVQGIYTRLDKWRDFVVSVAKSAAQTGNYPEPAWTQAIPGVDAGSATDDTPVDNSPRALGLSCKVNSDCATSSCASKDGTVFVCSQKCDPAASDACGEGFECLAAQVGGYCFARSQGSDPIGRGPGGVTTGPTTTTTSCAISAHGADSTLPVPWKMWGVAGMLLGLTFVRRARRS